MRPPPAHRATTAHLQAVYPFVSGGGLGGAGPLVGRDLLGGSFSFDPWDLYRRGALTNPNLIVLGQLGRGKSAFVKTYVWRQVAFGRQAWIVDPKGEYGALASACGAAPVKIAPGGGVRLNPLELPGGAPAEPGRAGGGGRCDLLCSLVASSLGRRVTPQERTAIDLAVRAVSRRPHPTLPDVVAALLDPDPGLAASVRSAAADVARDGRAVALEMRHLVEGDLAGMFDGPTSTGLDVDAPAVVLDLSAVFSSPSLALLMACCTSWMQSVLAVSPGRKRLVVVDEAWAILHDLGTARWMQSVFKLSRAYGVSNVAVVHRLSDLRAAGAEGSVQQRLAEGLLADSETRVVFGQSPSEAGATAELLDLTGVERDLVARLPRGVALWKVGGRSFLVEHGVAPGEAPLVDTDSAMRDAGPAAGAAAP